MASSSAAGVRLGEASVAEELTACAAGVFRLADEQARRMADAYRTRHGG